MKKKEGEVIEEVKDEKRKWDYADMKKREWK